MAELSFQKAATLCLLIFVCAAFGLYNVYLQLPNFSPEELVYIKLPRNLDDAKNLARVISVYQTTHYYPVMSAWCSCYVFMQTFSIPGSTFCSILGGFMWPWYLALPLICMCSGTGASLCYLMSKVVGQPLAKRLMPEKMAEWREKVQHHSDDLFNYILFLRITPFLPNWFINLTGPLVGVPLKPFFWGSVIGVAPLSMLAVQAGQTLYTLTSTSDTVTYKSVIFVFLSAVLSVLPIYFKRKNPKFADSTKTEAKTQ